MSDTQLLFLETSSFDNIIKLHNSAKSIFHGEINAIEYLDSISYELVRDVKGHLYNFPFDSCPTEPFYLLLEVNSSEETDDKIEEFFIQNESLIQNIMLSQTEAQSESIWGIRESVVEAANKKGYVFKYDLSLPIEHFQSCVDFSRDLFGGEVDIVGGYGHIGDGNIHLNIVRFGSKKQLTNLDNSQRKPPKEVKHLYEDKLMKFVVEHGGSISAEHGIGSAKKQYMSE